MSTTTQTPAVVAPVAPLSPIVWSVVTKGGDTVRKQADCAVSQAFAPKAARLADAQSKDMNQLLSGCYRPVLASVHARMSGNEFKALAARGISVNQAAPSKADMVPFATAVIALWVKAKGEKAAVRDMLQQYVNAVTNSVPVV